MAISVVVPKATEVSNWVLISSAARTASDVTADFPSDFFSMAHVLVTCAAASGTSPTLDIYVQRKNPDTLTYDDIAHFTQVVAALTTPLALDFVSGGNLLHTTTDATQTANTVRLVTMGAFWRIKFVIAGTEPSFTFGVFANFRQ